MEEIDLLKKVEKVGVPPFFMTRIQAKIRASEDAERLPERWKMTSILTFSVLVLGNIFFSKMNDLPTRSPNEQLVEQLKLQNNNQFYDE